MKHTIINKDILEGLDDIENESVDLVITSPPYNIGKSYETRSSLEVYLDWQKLVIEKLANKIKETGAICWQVGNFVEDGEVYPLDMLLYPIFISNGFHLRNRIIWHFGHGLHASKRLSGRYETIMWFTKSDRYVFNLDSIRVPSKYPGKLHYKGDKIGLPSGNPLGKNPSDFWGKIEDDWESLLWDIPNVKSNHPEKLNHPCQFPIEVAQRCIVALTHPNHTVLDPFMGVGSTLIASAIHSRNFVGVDNNKSYCNIASKRLEDFNNDILPIRELGKPVHQPTGKEKVTQIPIQWAKEEEVSR